MDHAARPLCREILERAGGVDLRGVPIEGAAQLGIGTGLAQRPGGFLHLLGGAEDVGSRPLGGAHDRVQGLRGDGEAALALLRRGEGGHLGAGAGDGIGHLHQVAAESADVVRPVRGDDVLDAPDRVQQHLGVGVAVAARVFGEEPPAPLGFPDGVLDGIVLRRVQRRQGTGTRHHTPHGLGTPARHAATIDGRSEIDRSALTAAYAFPRFAPPRDVFCRSRGAARFAAIP